MSKITLDESTIRQMSLFARVAKVSPRDCFLASEELLVFIIPKGTFQRAFGKDGENIKKLQNLFKLKIRIIEHCEDRDGFITNVIKPLKAQIEVRGETVVLRAADSKTKGLLIGRNAQNLRRSEAVVRRYFTLGELKVE